MIDTMLEDGVFSETESEEIRTIIPNHEGELKNNIESYVNVSYKLGIMYFYYSESGDVDVKNASKWLQIAAGESEEGPEKKQSVKFWEKSRLSGRRACIRFLVTTGIWMRLAGRVTVKQIIPGYGRIYLLL